MSYRKILCPIDFSPGSRDALATAAELARTQHAQLVLAHVNQPPVWMLGGEFQFSAAMIQEMIDADEAELAKWQQLAKELGATDVVKAFLTGAPWDQITRAAEQDPEIDLIVMGTHGRTGLKHVLLGSVAEKTVRHAPCSVLVVRRREA